MSLIGSRLLRISTHLGAWLTVCAIAVRILIPAGYMVAPMPGEGGLPAIVICTAQGAKTVSVDTIGLNEGDRQAPGPADNDSGADQGCIFAGAVTPLPVPGLQVTRAEAPVAVSQIDLPVAHQRPGLGLAAPPPFKTGPPIIV